MQAVLLKYEVWLQPEFFVDLTENILKCLFYDFQTGFDSLIIRLLFDISPFADAVSDEFRAIEVQNA